MAMIMITYRKETDQTECLNIYIYIENNKMNKQRILVVD